MREKSDDMAASQAKSRQEIARETRLKQALKANMGRRKAQARARAAADADGDAESGPGQDNDNKNE